MKKTQVALAALALVASSAAMAEVTIYGTLDAGIANTRYSGESSMGTYVSGGGGYSYGNNIGFKGSEDLGGGLKANFQLETGIDLNSGHPGNGGASAIEPNESSTYASSPIFNRVSTVGLSGEFGSVNIGQQLSPFIAAALSSVLSNGHFGVNRLVMGGAAALPGSGTQFAYGGFFVPNSVSYTAPALAGWTVSALTSTKTGSQGGSMPEPLDNERYSAVSLIGAIETVNIAVGYENRSQTYKNWVAGATTNIGDIQLAANYMSVKAEGASSVSSYALGVGYNLTPVLNVNAQYASNQDSATDKGLTAFTGKYTLSKRTSVYASYIRGTGGAMSSYDERGYSTTNTNNTTVVGVAHSF